jgi:hypothetical protein
MSARVESAPVGRFNVGAIAIATVVALGIGGLAGLLVTRATEERPAAVTTPVGIPYWDAQKLEAMEGRQLAAQVGIAGTQLWDAQKLEAMEGRQLAEQQFGIAGTQLWDAQKLDAMEGRQLAAQLRAEDPITKPHLPKRPPTG